MMHSTRRQWLTQSAASAVIAAPAFRLAHGFAKASPGGHGSRVERLTGAHDLSDGGIALAQAAVDAAMHAGAQYADARVTRTTQHGYGFGFSDIRDVEDIGFGVRVLVNGYWGFSAAPSGDRTAVERLARDAVDQAKADAGGAPPRTVDLGPRVTATGKWVTPMTIDPFSVSIEEKHAVMNYWLACAENAGVSIDALRSKLSFDRQERVLVTSEGTQTVQAVYESGGTISVYKDDFQLQLPIQGIETAGRGWELFLNAKIPEQLQNMPSQLAIARDENSRARPLLIGRYTLVCDGATMAALTGATLGRATELDRALGYEANANGTSYLDDPLDRLGTFQVASPLVTVTANRSMPQGLATVKWDDEGVAPEDFTLVKAGVLVDYQTTREQAAWLAPYYQHANKPLRSHGCAAATDALAITMQHSPNFTLEPSTSDVSLDALIGGVEDGLFIERGHVAQVDVQIRNGLLGFARVRKIKNGRLGPLVVGGAVLFNAIDLWKNVTVLGDASTCGVVPFSSYPYRGEIGQLLHLPVKGQPAQLTSYSVQAAAAVITNQPIIDPERKA
jgi:TldD protein